MAKITTRKPTTLIKPNRVSVQLEPGAPAEDTSSTEPVSAPPRKAAPPSPPPRTPQIEPPSSRELQPPRREPLSSTPLYDAPKKKGPPAVLIVIASLLVVASLFKAFGGAKGPALEDFGDGYSAKILLEDENSKLVRSTWRNEKPGFITRIFHRLCLGYAVSDGCREEPLHPFKQVYEEVGKPLVFPTEPDRKVISDTIEYSNRSGVR